MAENMNKDLMKAIQGVNKKFGADMSNFATEIEEKPIVSHSTGSRLLDMAIGDGERAGFPEGRMIELFGPESSGKCVTADTYLLTPKGYQTLESVFAKNGTPIEVKEEEVKAQIPLINRYGEEETTYAITFNGEKDVLKLTTKHGFEVKVTENHPLLVSDKWVEAKDIRKGQPLTLLKGTNIFNSDAKPKAMGEMTQLNEVFLLEHKDEIIGFLKGLYAFLESENGSTFYPEEARVLQLTLLNVGVIAKRTEEGLAITDEELEKLKRVIDGEEFEQRVFYDSVVAIEHIGKQPTFDVAMPDTQSFIGNGVINHNTTIALLAIAERQRIEKERVEADPNYVKKMCVFMDAEYALDEDLAESYGVDLDELIIIRPDQAEDGMDVLDSYIRTGGIGLAVIDSVN